MSGIFRRIFRTLTRKTRRRHRAVLEQETVGHQEETNPESERTSLKESNPLGGSDDVGTKEGFSEGPARYVGAAGQSFPSAVERYSRSVPKMSQRVEHPTQGTLECEQSHSTSEKTRVTLLQKGASMSLEEFCSKNIPLPCILKFHDGYTSLRDQLSIGAGDAIIVVSKQQEDVVIIETVADESSYVLPVLTKSLHVLPECPAFLSSPCEQLNKTKISGVFSRPYMVRTRGVNSTLSGQQLPSGSLLYVLAVVQKESTLKDVRIPVLQAKTAESQTVEIRLINMYKEATIYNVEFDSTPISILRAVLNFPFPLACTIEGAGDDDEEDALCTSIVMKSLHAANVLQGVLKDLESSASIQEEIDNCHWKIELPADQDLTVGIMAAAKSTAGDDDSISDDLEASYASVRNSEGNLGDVIMNARAVTLPAKEPNSSAIWPDDHECRLAEHYNPVVEPRVSNSIFLDRHISCCDNSRRVQQAQASLSDSINQSQEDKECKENDALTESDDPDIIVVMANPAYVSTRIQFDDSNSNVPGTRNDSLFLRKNENVSQSAKHLPLPAPPGGLQFEEVANEEEPDHELYIYSSNASDPRTSTTPAIAIQGQLPDMCSLKVEAPLRRRRRHSLMDTGNYTGKHVTVSKCSHSQSSTSFTEHSPCSSSDIEENLQFLVSLSISDVSHLLEVMNLSQYAQAFQAEQVDGLLMTHLTENLLQELGVASSLHLLRIMKVVNGIVSARALFDESVYSYI